MGTVKHSMKTKGNIEQIVVAVTSSPNVDWIGEDEIYCPNIMCGEVIGVVHYPCHTNSIKRLVVIEKRGDLPFPNEPKYSDIAVVNSKTACELGLDFGYDTIVIIKTKHAGEPKDGEEKGCENMKKKEIKSLVTLLAEENELCNKYNECVGDKGLNQTLINLEGMIRLKRREISKYLTADELYGIPGNK